MKKLAFCLFHYFPFGGLQRDFLRIAKACVAHGYEVDVFTMSWKGEKDPDLNIIELPSKALQNHTRIKKFIVRVEDELKLRHYDLVVGFNKMPGLNVYYAADTCYQAKTRKKHHWFYRLLPRYQHLVKYENAVFEKHQQTKILCISPKQQSEFIHYYHTPLSRFYLLPPGISRDRLAGENANDIRENFRKNYKISSHDFLLLFVGSGFKTKGLDRVLLGIAALSPALRSHVRLVVIGQDRSKPFERQARHLGISEHITFLGGRHDIALWMLAGDLLTHPAYNENTGTVLLEAIASGLPVVTTDVCGYAHYIEEAEAGMVLSSPYQQGEFNQVLAEMLSSPEHRLQWSKNGIAYAKQADIYSMPERAAELIIGEVV